MQNSESSAGVRMLTVIIGTLGLIISWIAFIDYTLHAGPDLLSFWTDALTRLGLRGLTYDLIACGAVLSVWAIGAHKRIGWLKVASICLTTWFLGVCGGLALWALWRPSSLST